MEIRDISRDGTRDGMPPFPLPEERLAQLATWVRSMNVSAFDIKPAGDAATGENLWHFETGQGWKASPMTYTVNSKQYVAIAAGNTILSLALPGTGK